MKKIFLLALFLTVIFSVKGQIIFKDFEDSSLTSYGWSTYSVTGDEYWEIYEYSGNKFAKMTGWDGSSKANEDWLITSPIYTEKQTQAILSFLTAKNYTGNDLQAFISSDYDGSSDPNTASWSNLNPILSAGSWVWTNSGDIDLSSYLGQTLYIGFKYTSDATNSATWEVDDYLITFGGYPHYYISEIRNPDANGIEKKIGLICEVSGVIHGFNELNTENSLLLNLLDVTGGILLYSANIGTYGSLVEGDSIIARGTVSQYSGNLQITIDTIIYVNPGNSLNYPLKVDAIDETTEGRYVYIPHVKVSGSYTSSSDGHNVNVTDGINTYPVWIDDDNTNFYNNLLPTGYFNITGLSKQYDTSSPYLSDYELVPLEVDSITPTCLDTNIITINDTIIVFDTTTTTYYDTTQVLDTINISICDSTVMTYDTTMVFDTTTTTFYDTTQVLDTINISICDSTVTIYDTTITTIYDSVDTYYDTVITYTSISVTDTLIIDVTLSGISPPNNINTIKVFPNPTKDFIIIDNGNYTSMSNYTLKIMNTLGQDLFSSNITIPQFSIDISILGSTGLYYIQILDANSNIVDTRKLILK